MVIVVIASIPSKCDYEKSRSLQTSFTCLLPTPSGEHPQCPGNWARRGVTINYTCYNITTAAICHNRDIIATQVSRPRHSPHVPRDPDTCPAELRTRDSAPPEMECAWRAEAGQRPALPVDCAGDPSSGVICIVHGHCSSNHGTR